MTRRSKMKEEFLREIGLNDEQVRAITLRRAVETRLEGESFTSEFARKGVLAEIWSLVGCAMTRGSRVEPGMTDGEATEDGEVLGVEEAFCTVRESNPDAFEKPRPENPNKLSLPPMGGTGAEKGNNPFRRETWNMSEQARLLRENRDMAVFFQKNARG